MNDNTALILAAIDTALTNSKAPVPPGATVTPVGIYRKLVDGVFVKEYRANAGALFLVEPLKDPSSISREVMAELLSVEPVAPSDLRTTRGTFFPLV